MAEWSSRLESWAQVTERIPVAVDFCRAEIKPDGGSTFATSDHASDASMHTACSMHTLTCTQAEPTPVAVLIEGVSWGNYKAVL